MKEKCSVFIAGAGGIGSAVGLILREWNKDVIDLYFGDLNSEATRATASWILDNTQDGRGQVDTVLMPPDGTSDKMEEILQRCDIILDCLPGSQAPRIAELAQQYRLHYANLTEYVAETKQIQRIAAGAKKGFILQTGLAPGFIDVLAHALFRDFCRKHQVERVESVAMKVGALTKNAFPPHYYGFTWSPIGVATEYVEPAVVIRDYGKLEVESLSDRKTVIINEQLYEEDLTSGGAADLPEFLAGKTRTLDYKTLRHPGHYAWVDNLLATTNGVETKAEMLQANMLACVPMVEDDYVLIYAAVQGKDSAGVLHIQERSYHIGPCQVGKAKLKAIQATTAASLAECARILRQEKHQGVILQSQLDPEDFLKGEFVQKVYGP